MFPDDQYSTIPMNVTLTVGSALPVPRKDRECSMARRLAIPLLSSGVAVADGFRGPSALIALRVIPGRVDVAEADVAVKDKEAQSGPKLCTL